MGLGTDTTFLQPIPPGKRLLPSHLTDLETTRFAFKDAELAAVWGPADGFCVVRLYLHATVAHLAH